MVYLLLGIATGCFMYAFVNSRYNDDSWISSKYIWGLGFVTFIVGLLMIFIK